MRPPAVLIAALLAVALLGVACGPTAQVIGTPTPDDLPTAQPTPVPFGAFTALASFPTDGAYEVSNVIATAAGFVAVGFGGLNGDDYFGRRQGIVWRSADGVSWTESIDASLVNVTPVWVVARGNDLYIGGYVSACSQLADSCSDIPQAGNGVWRSSGLGPWQLLPQLPDMQLGYMDNFLLLGDQLVVYGAGSDDNQTTTVWLSADGTSWTATTDLAGMDPISSMAQGPSGISAFGTRYDDSMADIVPVAAVSTDGGVHFSPASVPALTGAGIDALAVGAGGLVGVGYRSTETLDNSGVAVSSADGMTWTEATNSDGSFPGSALQTVHALAGGGYIAVGYTPRTDDSGLQDGAAWFSADGVDWKRVAVLDGGFSQLSTSALGTAGLVVFAAEQIDTSEDATSSVIHAWFAPAASLHG